MTGSVTAAHAQNHKLPWSARVATVPRVEQAWDRLVAVDGALNFRDLGGYDTTGGVVATGRVFRSDSLHRCSDGDLA